MAATILGDIGEVDDRTIDNSNGYYKPGDYVGKSGIEKVYEKELGGKRGKNWFLLTSTIAKWVASTMASMIPLPFQEIM